MQTRQVVRFGIEERQEFRRFYMIWRVLAALFGHTARPIPEAKKAPPGKAALKEGRLHSHHASRVINPITARAQ
jgi:hypothetical protein